MHSVALEKAAIAHIPNAEDGKIYKVAAQDSMIEEIRCINESVKRTIAQVTLLENQLTVTTRLISSLQDRLSISRSG